MANKRQKKKQLKKAVQIITKAMDNFERGIDGYIKNNPYEAKEKLLNLLDKHPDNSWAWYFITRCNDEINKRNLDQSTNS